MLETNKGSSGTVEELKASAEPRSGSAIKDKAKDLAAGAAELAGQAQEEAQEWAARAAEKADDARTAVGQGMESLAGKIRDQGPQTGMLGSASAAVADSMESAGSYLKKNDFTDMGEDFTNLIRRYPIASLFVAVGLGCLLGRATRS